MRDSFHALVACAERLVRTRGNAAAWAFFPVAVPGIVVGVAAASGIHALLAPDPLAPVPVPGFRYCGEFIMERRWKEVEAIGGACIAASLVVVPSLGVASSRAIARLAGERGAPSRDALLRASLLFGARPLLLIAAFLLSLATFAPQWRAPPLSSSLAVFPLLAWLATHALPVTLAGAVASVEGLNIARAVARARALAAGRWVGRVVVFVPGVLLFAAIAGPVALPVELKRALWPFAVGTALLAGALVRVVGLAAVYEDARPASRGLIASAERPARPPRAPATRSSSRGDRARRGNARRGLRGFPSSRS